MKRSKAITLTLFAGTAMVLGACDDDNKPVHVKDEADCAEAMADKEGCHNAAVQAERDFEKNAPRYDDQKSCEEQFGPDRCRRVERDGTRWFMPSMTGFMIGRMLEANQYRVQPACRNGDQLYSNGCGPIRSTPHVYSNPALWTRAGSYSGGSFRPEPAYAGSWTSGKVAASRASMGSEAVAARASVARGGFGASAHGMAGE